MQLQLDDSSQLLDRSIDSALPLGFGVSIWVTVFLFNVRDILADHFIYQEKENGTTHPPQLYPIPQLGGKGPKSKHFI